MSAQIVNIAAYRFARLSDLKELRARLLKEATRLDLKGTILLSTEGINLFIAGEAAAIDRMLETLRAIPGLEDLEPKFSRSARQPFRRMLVRIKKEIISFGVPGIDPAEKTSERISPHTLKDWLDEGKPITLLDTRNDYEVKLGTFRGAKTLDITHFRELPKAVETLPEDLRSEPVVVFCTGGIRCEKAGPYLESVGFENVLQLDGGILRYFEECGNAHYEGECFVFDDRTGLDPALRETDSTQCRACQTPLTPEEQEDPRYVPAVSCPWCFERQQKKTSRRIAELEKRIHEVATPLPGSVLGELRRPIRVTAQFDGHRLQDFLRTALPHLPEEHWKERFEKNLFRGPGDAPVTAETIVRAGERYFSITPLGTEPEVHADIKVLHLDSDLLVVHKPAPLPVHPGGRFQRNTLLSILREVLRPLIPRVVHRLDADTSGVLVFALSARRAASMQELFASGQVRKTYLALVHGHPEEAQLSCDRQISPTALGAGTRECADPGKGQPARTEFRLLETRADGTSVLECRPVTGRTNQIRLHLQSLGLPIVGDRSYAATTDREIPLTRSPDDPPLHLFAAELEFPHPATGAPLRIQAQCPWFPKPVEQA